MQTAIHQLEIPYMNRPFLQVTLAAGCVSGAFIESLI